MMELVKRNIFFMIILLLSFTCLALLWIYFGLGISFGSIFIYQGILMFIPMAEINVDKRLKIQILITGLVIGPIQTLIYTFICLGYIFDYQFMVFNNLMGFNENEDLQKAAFIEYSIALFVNIVYLVILFVAQKRQQQMVVNQNMNFVSNLQNNSNSRINQTEAQMSILNDEIIVNQNNSNNDIRNNQNNILYLNNQAGQQLNNYFQNNQNDNIFQIFQQGFDMNQRRQLQLNMDSQRNLSSYEEEKEDFDILTGQFLIHINGDDERQETVKTTVYSRDADSKDEGKECAICYEEFDKIKSINDKRLIQLTCSHTFHATCIRNSIQSIGWKCPYCRTNITQKISKCKQQGSENIRYNFVYIEPNRLREFGDIEFILL